jgi:hypothetical protein
MDALVERFSDRLWRLNNLYQIIDKSGNPVQFVMNRAQRRLLKRMHHRNVILKARQLGFSTFIQLYMLDATLWNSHLAGGVIAQDKESAGDIFENKVKFAFERLPQVLQDHLAPKQDSIRKLVFANGSSVTVGTSMRSGTLQMLHVSEMGKIAARYPDKAREIVTGSFEAVPLEGIIWVESTAEGREGAFYDLVKRARDHQDSGRPLGSLDWAFHFFPWHDEPSYRSDPEQAVIHPHLREYFGELEAKHGIRLTPEQQAWYALKERDLGDDMKREHPSHPDEAFEQAIVGAYYASQFRHLRQERRITTVPHTPELLVHTAWDLGMSDSTAIWFVQVHGREVRLIDYLEDSGEGIAHYAAELQKRAEEKKFRYGRHFGPHDIEVRELGTGKSRVDTALEHGIRFEVVPRIERQADGIEAVRQFLPLCWFDEEGTADGVKAVEHYRRQWDERLGTYKSQPLHDWASHGAKAFETLARADLFSTGVRSPAKVQTRTMMA